MEEEKKINLLAKIGTLGGPLRVRKDKIWVYGLNEDNKNLGSEKLFGMKGPLHPGMPYKKTIALEASTSDTKETLVKELVEQSSFTRREAEEVVNTLIREGKLVEIDHPGLGKVLVFKG